jgi:hypothetical protein
MNTPILFIIFNRLDTTKKVLSAIKNAKPPRLYVAADGARQNKEGESEKVQAIRNYVLDNIDWDCEVKTLFREKNVGCKEAVSNAITWLFEHEESGIILEDDCLPHSDFFGFCDTLLTKYADDERIAVITGNNFQNGIKRGEASYYFSKYNHVWGWATWRRAWKNYSGEIPFLPSWLNSNAWHETCPNFLERRYWGKKFTQCYEGKFTTAWDYPWTACLWYREQLTITPNVNLVSNIGFSEDSTHTHDINSPLNSIATYSIGDLVHPDPPIVVRNLEADLYTYKSTYGKDKIGFLQIFKTVLKYVFVLINNSFTGKRPWQ